ncbi:caspase domain-containing protein [Shimia isoporae]|uniref:Caspase domain-containing protein n=1 Tax=Shimia isoporae TaxID=647720 RepID=A0A4R1N7S9_9RHOB|nr:caspase family protein [Shimia isoporae]TCL01144.1 caspase domain-containing protein [Shimia isoporae]
MAVEIIRPLLFVGLLFGWNASALSQESHVALLVGISNYDYLDDLQNASRDAHVLAIEFERLGYETKLVTNPSRAEMLRALAELRIRASEASQVVIYIAGHGVQIGAQNYVLLRDARAFEGGWQAGSVSLPTIFKAVSDKPRQKIVFWDACRVPAVLQPATSRHGRNNIPAGSYVAYAAQPGFAAFDGFDGNSPFTAALLEELRSSSGALEEKMRKVRLRVTTETAGQQVPWTQSSLLRLAYLRSDRD